jgi:hypothetical protein
MDREIKLKQMRDAAYTTHGESNMINILKTNSTEQSS